MDKLKMQTHNIVDENIKKIAELFPNCLTERLDENGKPEAAIDFDQLRQELSKDIVEGPEERYQFTWPDKRNAIRLANAPTTDTLRPCREESVDFDNTQNLYIEGDNLEVLKLLRENYLGKVKMIYIDPPYNTGNDFVYNDDFAQTAGDYVHNSGQEDEEGNRLVANTESNGRFHTDWLNMIYPRLKVAKDLLSEDGVIFISIDDHEITNAQRLCNEVFGESNYVGTFFWQSKKGGGSDNNTIVKDIEYVVCYARNINNANFFNKILVEAEELDLEDEKGKYRKGRELNKWGANSRREDRPTMFFPIKGPNGEDVYPIRNDGSEGCWRWGRQNMSDAVNNNDVLFESRGDGTYIVYEKIRTTDARTKPYRAFLGEVGATADGSKQIKSIFDDTKVFDFPKPIALMDKLIEMGSVKESIVLDFFSGSATTAHAVIQLNAEDGGNRKFIMVQLPEATDEKSEAYKAGYKNICEIGKERIRRAGKKIVEELEKKKVEEGLFAGSSAGSEARPLDIGFRVLKLDSSNMQDVYYSPEQFNENLLFEDNIKHDRTDEDLLFQAMIELGIELSAKIEKREIAGKTVWSVADNYLMACFDKDVNETTITEIARQHPYYFVLRDASLATDNVADNFEQIWEEYSKETVRRII
jgi:adenine-specific DNA-methyltransferase